MYLYFDTQGNLKEQINDQALRQGNSNINYLYVYWEKSEDNENITGLWARFKADDGTYNPSSSTWIQSNTYVEQTIPYDKSRDLKFFNYFKTYKFYVIQLPDAVLGQSGAWLGTLQFVETNSITTLGQLAFYVSESNASVEADENINIAQWNYLIALVSGALDSIPTKTSDLINDSGYITSASFDGYVTDTELETTLEDYAQTDDLPTKTSDLTNDSGYQTQTQVQTAINNALTSVYKFQGSISVSDLNDYISSYTGDKNNLNGWVFNITDSGNLNNSSGTTPVAAGDNVAFYVYNTSQQLYEWDKLAGTIDLSSYALKSELPTKTSDLTNDNGFITNSVNNLTNYYKKTETYDQDEIDALINTRMIFKGYDVVGALNSLVSVTTDKSTLNGWTYKIASGGTLNNYETTTTAVENDVVVFKYISATNWLWIKISNVVDLTSYALKSEIPTDNSELTNGAGYQTSSQVQTKINNALTNVYTFIGSISVADLNEFIVQRTDPISELKGQVYNITDSGNLNNYSGTTSVIAGDNVAFVYISDTNWHWDKLAGTIDTSNFVTLNGTQEITGKKTFDYAGGIYLTEKTSTPASTDGLQAQDDNHLYWKGQRMALETDIASEISNGVPYLTSAPTANNTSGKLKFVVLSSEPVTYYTGYYYIITGSNGGGGGSN